MQLATNGNDTGGKFATGIIDTSGDLRISPRILKEIQNYPNVIFSGLGEDDLWKKSEAKNLETLSF